MTTELYNIARQRCEKMQFYCPHGHAQHYVRGESELDKMRRERDRAVQDQARLEIERDVARAEVDKAAKSIKRMKKRANAGVCPCCNRTFSNMGAHMKTQHPDYESENVVKLKRV
jgi:hypothetical protein